MTSILLSINPSKTEFMLIGLPQQRSKISNVSLSLSSSHPITPTHSARNTSLIQVSLFLNRFHFYPVVATIISATFTTSGTLSTSKYHRLTLPSRDMWRGPVIQLPGGMFRSTMRTTPNCSLTCKSWQFWSIAEDSRRV